MEYLRVLLVDRDTNRITGLQPLVDEVLRLVTAETIRMLVNNDGPLVDSDRSEKAFVDEVPSSIARRLQECEDAI
jgi:hypothetical protein